MNNIQNLLAEAVKSLGGQDKAVEACNRMYSGVWRSEPFDLSELEDSDLAEIGFQFSELVFSQTTGQNKTDFDLYVWERIVYDWLDLNPISFGLPSDSQVVYLCNYKGEGEGVALFELAKHLPVFKSKSHSFYDVN